MDDCNHEILRWGPGRVGILPLEWLPLPIFRCIILVHSPISLAPLPSVMKILARYHTLARVIHICIFNKTANRWLSTTVLHCMVLVYSSASLPLLPSLKRMSTRSSILARKTEICISNNTATRWLLTANLQSTIAFYTAIIFHFIIFSDHNGYEMLQLSLRENFIDI